MRRRVALEPLEPRILLSADPTLLALLDTSADEHSRLLEESPVLAEQLEDREVDRVSEEASDDDWIVDGQSESAVLDEWVTPADSIAETSDASDEPQASTDSDVTLSDTGSQSIEGTPGLPSEQVEPTETDSAEVNEAEIIVALVTFDNTSTTSSKQADAPVPNEVPEDSLARGPPSTGLVDSTPTVENILLNGDPLPSEDYCSLSEGALNTLAREAIARWQATNPTIDLTWLDDLTFQIADLPDRILAQTEGSLIRIDVDAAGHGWFIDLSPSEDGEYEVTLSGTLLSAGNDSPAQGRVDLLTVLMHEIGHVLGYEHAALDGADSAAVMAEELAPGQRVLLATTTAPLNPTDPDELVADGTQAMSDFDSGSMDSPPVSPPFPIATILDLSQEAVDLTIEILANGDVVVSGSASHDGTYFGITEIISGSGSDTLIGPDLDSVWQLTGTDAGQVNGLAFQGIESLTGGSGQDTFIFTDGAAVSGTIDGGAGIDTLDYSAYLTGVFVDLSTGAATGTADISGIRNVTGGLAADTIWGNGGDNVISGGAGDDTLLLLGGAGSIDGGAGDDTLLGPDADSIWTITGLDAGDVNGVTFVGMENLLGSADNEDTFVIEPGGSLSGLIDGGPGGFDSLVVQGGVCSALAFAATGPDSGSIDDGGRLITYAGLEPITYQGTAEHVVVTATDDADTLTLEADPGDDTMIRISGSIETTSISKPTMSLEIYLGSDDDSLTISSLGAFAASLTISGDAGNDSVTIDADQSLILPGEDLEITAETITVAAGAVVSTWQNDPSTGDSGNIWFEGTTITIGSADGNAAELSGSGVIVGDVVNQGTLRPGNSPGIINIDGDYTTLGTTQIEIAGGDGVPGVDFDQINVTGLLTLGGTLEIVLLDGFAPAEGDTFDILTFGDVSGAFDDAIGMYGFGDGTLFLEVVVLADRVQLVAKVAPGGNFLLSRTPLINDVLGQYYSDYFTFDASVSISGELAIGDFATVSGSLEFGVNLAQAVTLSTGLSSNLAGTPTGDLIALEFAQLLAAFTGITLSSDLTTLIGVPVTTLQIGGSNIQMFAGTNGPYWTDLDGDGNIGWSFDTGDGSDASRTINAITDSNGVSQTSVVLDGTTYSVGQILGENLVLTLGAGQGTLTIGREVLLDEGGNPILDDNDDPQLSDGTVYGDIDRDGKVDAEETGELSENATGLSVTNVDFGYVAMMALPPLSLLPLEGRFFQALTASASQVGLVGIEQVELSADNVLVEINAGQAWDFLTPGVKGTAVVNFPASFPAEPENVDEDGDGVSGEPAGYEVGTGAQPVYVDVAGKRTLASVDDALLSIGNNDGKFVYVNGDLAFEKGSGGTVTIATGLSPNLDGTATELLVRAQFVLGTLLGNNATLSDDLQTIDNVQASALKIGGSDIQVFAGVNGPYWTDLDGDGNVGWSFNAGTGDAASRTIAAITDANGDPQTSVVLDGTTYNVGDELTENTVLSLGVADGVIEIGDAAAGTDVRTGDINRDGVVAPDETGELSENATGLSITNVDFGYVALTPKLKLPLLKSQTFTGFKLTASDVGLVGIEQVELGAQNVLVEVNTGPTWTALGIRGDGPAVVDFETSFPAEDAGTDPDGDGLVGEPAGFQVPTGTTSEPVYVDFDGNERIGASVDNALLSIGDNDGKFVYLNGNLSFEKGPTSIVTVATGISANIPEAFKTLIKAEFALRALFTGTNATLSDDVQTIENVQVAALQIGGSDIQAFVGLNGPYWTDLDKDGNIGWSFNAGTGDAASRTIAAITDANGDPQTSVVLDGTTYNVGDELTENTVLSLGVADGVIEIGDAAAGTDVRTGDINRDGVVDPDETSELNERAAGVSVTDVDFGYVAMTPTKQLPMLESQTFTALRVEAAQAGLVGIDEVLLDAKKGIVNVNVGPDWGGSASGQGPAVIDFATSFPAEGAGDDPDGDGTAGEPAGFEVRTGTTSEPIYIDFDGNERIGASVEVATLQISEFVHITGSIAFEKGPVQTVNVTGGLLTELGTLAGDFLTDLGLPADFADSFPAASGSSTQLAFMTVGASNVHAFVGIDGPYWTDLDRDGDIGWAFDTGDGDDASRTIDAITDASGASQTSVEIDGTTYSVGQVLAQNTVVMLGSPPEANGTLTVGGVEYGDINADGTVDADETQELNEESVGLVVEHFDFGMAVMTPTNPVDFAKYFALRASADQIGLVGIDDVTVNAQKILVEVNQSSPSVYGLPLFPVVDFATTPQWADEQTLFDENDDGNLTLGDLATLNTANSAGITALNGVLANDPTPVDQERLLSILDTADPESLGVIDIAEAAALFGGTTAEAWVSTFDADGDGKIDPLGFGVNTGGTPVYLDMDSSLIRAQGFVELNILDVVILTGSVAFELGPTQQVTLADAAQTTKTVTTLTIGAASVSAFIGANGPYWTDLDGNGEVSWSFVAGDANSTSASRTITALTDAGGSPVNELTVAGVTYSVNQELAPNTVVALGENDGTITVDTTRFGNIDGDSDVDVDETAELSSDAVGLAITDLHMGIVVMAATQISDLGVYLAAKASVPECGVVGVSDFTADGALDIELNVGFGLSGFDPSFAVVDFPASFNEANALFDIIDVSDNGIIETSELDDALAAGASYADEILSFFDANDDQEITVEDLRALTTQTEVAGLFDATTPDGEVLSSAALIEALGGGDGVLDLADVALFGDGAGGITASGADADGDGRLEPIGGNISTVEQLVSALNIGGAPQPDGIPVTDLLNVLSDSFKTIYIDAIQAADADRDGKLDFGFEVNTGDSTSPVVLDFDQFLISITLGGEIELDNVFRMYGVFLFEASSSGLKVFAAAGIEIGPDIGSSSKLFRMNALGALVINGDGIAADIEISVNIGGALSGVLRLDVTARLVFNTTSQNQTVTIPAKYVNFLIIGGDTIPASDNFEPSQVDGLQLSLDELNDRFTVNSDGSATYTIPDRAPGQANAGFYLLATFDGQLTIANTFEITADFSLLLTGQSFELGFTGFLGLGGFGSFVVAGGAVIDGNGFAAYGLLSVNIDVLGLVQVSGSAELFINTATSGDPVSIDLASGSSPDIDPNTYLVAIDATIDLFGVVSAQGNVELGVESGLFVIAVNQLNIDLFILNLDISGFIRSDGQFSLSGALQLDLTASGFGILGEVAVSISNSGFTGSGFVAIVLFGQSFDIAAAELSVTTNPSSVFIRAEGPLGVYLTVLIDSSGVTFGGGLGFLDDVIGAIADVAEAVGEAVVEAAEAVADAFVALGDAILDFGADVVEFFDGLFTDIADLFEDIVGAIEEFFSSSRTIVVQPPNPVTGSVESYSVQRVNPAGNADPSGRIIRITNLSATRIAAAVVDGTLIIDAPDNTADVVVAQKKYQTRYWSWSGWPWEWGWTAWSTQSTTDIYRTVTFTNMSHFVASSVDRIIIHGTNDSETIVLDKDSIINIDAEVYGNGGDDTIVTGGGNDYVEGGSGHDTIFAYAGNDTVYGDVRDNDQIAGNDKLIGGTGNDILMGGPGDDLLDESFDRGDDPDLEIDDEFNTLNGGSGVDKILGSPGVDTIVGGPHDDVMTGLNNDDIYVFGDNFGEDLFSDYFGAATLDFSQVASDLEIEIADTGFRATDNVNATFAIDDFIQIGQNQNFDDFEIVQIETGTGNDDVNVSALPLYRMDISDAGGRDTYDCDFDLVDTGQSVARVDIVDNSGNSDRIELDLDSTGFPVYLHPQAVLLNNFHLTFNTGVDELDLTDHAAQTTVTTQPGSGLTTLLLKSGVTVSSQTGGSIELLARTDFDLRAGATIETTGNVVIRGDDDDADSAGATIDLLGTINADQVEVFGNDDGDTVNVGNVTSGTETAISTFAGVDTINIRTIDAETTVNAGSDDDTINVGSLAPASGGTLNAISGPLTVNGETGSDVLNVDDTGDMDANTGVLTATMLTGLGLSDGITYGTLEALTIGLGSGGDTFTIESTHTVTTTLNANAGADTVTVLTTAEATTVNAGSGDDTINVGSLAPASGGTLNAISGPLTVHGETGSDTLTVDDTGDPAPNTGALTAATITGLGMSDGIGYGTVESVNIGLGSGGDSFTIETTHLGSTTLSTHAGNDTVHVLTTAGVTTIDAADDQDTINVQAIGAETTVSAGSNDDTINVGSLAPASGGTLNAISGPLTVHGEAGIDTLTVDDTGDPAPNTGALTATTITGLGMSDGIGYGTVESVNIGLGSGGDSFTVETTHLGSTTLSTHAGNDTVHVLTTAGVTTIDAADDQDTVNVQAIGAETTVNAGSNDDTINVGSLAPASGGTLNGIGALLTISGEAGADTLTVDDTGDPDPNTGAMTSTTITGLGMSGGINYEGLEVLNIGLGSGADTFTIESTHLGTTTLLSSNAGDDTVNVQTIGAETTVSAGSNDDTINVGSLAPASGGTLNAISGLLTVDGEAGTDILNVDDTGDPAPNTGTLTATTITGLGMSDGITYGTLEHLNIGLGSGGDSFTIESTHGGTTSISFGDGGDTINVRTTGGALTIDAMGGNDIINVGSLAPAIGGTLNGIGGLLTIEGDGESDILNVDDTGDTNPNTGTLTASSLTGPGMQDGIVYTNIENLEISLGSGNDSFTVSGTMRRDDGFRVVTVVNTGSGDDAVAVSLQAGTDGFFALNTEAGSDDVDAGTSTLPLVIFGGADNDSIVGGQAEDILFGDRGRVDYRDASGTLITRLGIGLAERTVLYPGAPEQSPLDVPLRQSDGVAWPPQLVVTRDATVGGSDLIRGGAMNDLIFGGTAGDEIHGGVMNDLVFGDHGMVAGVVDLALLPLAMPVAGHPFVFSSIDTQGPVGGNDVIFGNDGEDILLGQQGDDEVRGGADDDDLIGGHNVSGGHDGNDILDGEQGDDVVVGDNGAVLRTGGTLSPRIRILIDGVIYDGADIAQVAEDSQGDPTGRAVRDILILDHAEDTPNTMSGDDVIAGGPGADVLFGHLGDDVIQGDASVDVNPFDGMTGSLENATDGDDYIEGNGGSDVIFGNLGQDDILGGSSELFGLATPDLRPDGSDIIFGGSGTRIGRNAFVGSDFGTVDDDAYIALEDRHSRDADMILGDNGNIFRLVGTNGTGGGAFLEFNYDQTSAFEDRGDERIVVRAADLLDYTPGGIDFDPANVVNDIGDSDEIHGESGDDFIYGMKDSDVLYGDSDDDDLIGGYGHDWFSGGSGQDGVIGDDGRVYTSRNEEGDPAEFSEPLYGIAKLDEVNEEISTPGKLQLATIHHEGILKKTVNLTPFTLGDMTDPLFDPQFADDIIYGGLGGDFLHGASGDDGISGAEALFEYYVAPENPGDVLGYGATDRPNEFAAYDEFNPRRKILVDANGEFLEPDEVDPTAREFVLNFDRLDGPMVGMDDQGNEIHFDGDDRLFGDLGNDWLVGGTGEDHIYGGYGDDLLNADDNHDSTIDGADPRANDIPDTHGTYEDIAYGGAGRDILIGNTGGDRLIDWAGEFNSYIVPFAPFGAAAISRSLQPHIFEYLYDLSESDGADATRAADTGADPARNGEPEGEIGLVKQSDFDWHDQTGAPDDPQPGNIPGGPRDVLRSAKFNNGQAEGFVPDSGMWRIEGGRLEVEPEIVGGDAVSVFYVDNVLPSYFEMEATINAAKRTGLYDSNAYVVFDYQDPQDFRFAGVDNMINKLVMGHRNAQGWFIDVQTPMQVQPNTDYNMLLALHGVNATLVVDNQHVLTYTYEPRVVDGISFGLNTGMVGIGANNSIARIDNVAVQILPPEITFEGTEEFPDSDVVIDLEAETGIWTPNGERYDGAPVAGEDVAISLVDLGNPDPFRVTSLLEIEVVLDAETMGGVVFDLASNRYKFAAILPDADQVVIGHVTKSGVPVFDAVADFVMEPGVDHELAVSLKGTSVSVAVDGHVLLGHFFNSVTADGRFGLYTVDGSTSFDSIEIRTDDPSMEPLNGDPLAAALPANESITPTAGLQLTQLEPVVDAALQLWSVAQPGRFGVATLEQTTFEIVDLPGRVLGLTLGQTVKIDSNGAGHGWFVGRSTEDDRLARIDLLTVVLHELGHVLGLAHDAEGEGLMAASLETGERRLPDAFNGDDDASGSMPANGTESDGERDASNPTVSAWLGYRFPVVRINGLPIVSSGDREASDDERNPLLGDLDAETIFR